MLSCLFKTAKALFLTLLGLLRRALCCRRATPRQSCGDITFDRQILVRGVASEADLTSWDTWGDDPTEVVVGTGKNKPETVADRIQAYREALQDARRQAERHASECAGSSGEPPMEDDRDQLFADLAPQVKKQKKVYVGSSHGQSSSGVSGSRLGVRDNAGDPLLALGDELTDWDRPEKGGGWEAEDQDMSEVLREQRKQVKLQQQQQQ